MLLKVILGGEDNGNEGKKTETETNTETETLRNMHITSFPEMSLFLTDIVFPNEDENEEGMIIVTYDNKKQSSSSQSENNPSNKLVIPLSPSTTGLKELDIEMHRSPTKAFNMGPVYNDWFSERFGYRVILAYLGENNSRAVLGSFAPALSSVHSQQQQHQRQKQVSQSVNSTTTTNNNNSDGYGQGFLSKAGQILGLGSGLGSWSWFSSTTSTDTNSNKEEEEEERITFADCAPYLIVSETSLHNVSARVQPSGDGETETGNKEEMGGGMDITKFRPNIVISGAPAAFEEDFWAELIVGHDTSSSSSTPEPAPAPTSKSESDESNNKKISLLLTANCVRCQSINVDYETGKHGTGKYGTILKRLMKDRRVDKGAPYSPVFGRYGFLGTTSTNSPHGLLSTTSTTSNTSGSSKDIIKVGDEVLVSRIMKERSVNGELTTILGYNKYVADLVVLFC